MIKLTIIGAGSAVFTKNIVVDLLHISSFKNMHISLMDIDETRLNLAKELIDSVSYKLNAILKLPYTLIEKKLYVMLILFKQLFRLVVTSLQQL